MSSVDIERDAIGYLALAPRPTMEVYCRARVVDLALSAPDAVSYAIHLARTVNTLNATTVDPDSRRAHKNAAYWARQNKN